MAPAVKTRTPVRTQALSGEDAREIAADVYTYAYPLVLMELPRRVATNVEAPGAGKAPVNQFNHLRAFPNATFTDVVRPNADTLYSILWFDVSSEPLVIDIPDSSGRYYLLEMMTSGPIFRRPARDDARGNNGGVAGPHWNDDVPSDMLLIRSPTAFG